MTNPSPVVLVPRVATLRMIERMSLAYAPHPTGQMSAKWDAALFAAPDTLTAAHERFMDAVADCFVPSITFDEGSAFIPSPKVWAVIHAKRALDTEIAKLEGK
jgi:hypothetical protein